ncbi:GGDEF domain-containing protein [Candidatus Gracilibacteria bacterium]|nr:GGDEF domain-containing protein [Candidatus Gracilibacteria bacterium]
MTFTEIYNKIESGRVGQLYTFDLRFIKEINDNLGLVSGDMAIKETWNQLRNKIDSQDEGYISFGRRGGTFYLVVDKGYILSEQTMQAIDSFSHSNILSDENHETQSVPIGCASVSFGDDIIEKEELKKCIDILYEKTNEDWSLKILEELEKINLKEAKNSQQLTKDSLVYKFFTGKRKIERQNAIKKIIFDKYKNNIQVFQSLMTTIASLDIE